MSERVGGEWTLRCDGGARGNPGPGAYGYVLVDPGGAEREARGEVVGVVTNNVAEYRGLLAGLEAARRHGVTRLAVFMDSELVVRQVKGEYRVKNAGLKSLHAEVVREAAGFASLRLVAVRRGENARADELVNLALDRNGPVGTPR